MKGFTMEKEWLQGILQDINFDIAVKKYGSMALIAILGLICFVHRDDMPNLIAGLSIFTLLLIIFLVGLWCDLRALKHYKELIKDEKRTDNEPKR